jgi:hypothetical protein
MTERINNARIVQREDLSFDLVYEDEQGHTVDGGNFTDALEADKHLGELRAAAARAE